MRGLESSQKKLYLSVKKELALYERKTRKELRAYEKSFRATLPQKKIRTSSRAALLSAIEKARVVLVGDFHPFRQSQKGFIRLVEGAAPAVKRPVIGLECFQQAHQAAIGEFLSGLITADELRDKVDFERYWPFSWENYREILLLARANQFPVIALNIVGRKGKGSVLAARDEAAAARIAQEISRHPKSTVFVLYGELHLGHKHLPRALGRTPTVIVHQNNVDLYWKSPTLPDGQRPEVLLLEKGEFCILNSVPWVKLRSYLDWLEGSSSPLDDDDIDVVGTVHHYARLLAEAAGLPPPVDDTTEIFPPDQLSGQRRGLPSPDREFAAHALAFHRTGYLPLSAAILLPTVSTNSMSEAATHLLRHSLSAPANKRYASEDWISHFLLGYLGSKILNPKRKCNEVPDLTKMAAQKSGKRAAIAGRALALLAPYLKIKAAKKKKLPGASEMEACRTAGFILGERFFLALLAEPKLFEDVSALFSRHEGATLLRFVAGKIAKVEPASKLEKF
ncbi:MAG: ChaN family lipoprotein [Bdellovibrionota bacterium]